ncbi:hypothetical protein [Crateriforma conspicua]|uniref:Uncharacterized protein n=1 Tax=Crateriforma conspicua TaxID=2527996 RepID=A0A5C5YH65_9PLAN|nr:hypothetical protein [Crateriforma conspicua]TWT72612.1 hypothetical protein Pan14r_49320 [Crateriforma conspicua]
MRLKLAVTAGLIAGMCLIAPAAVNWADDTTKKGELEKNTHNVGRVIFTRLPDDERNDQLTEHLHFCVFDNGKNDQIYVATRWGMWSKGEFDLSVGKKVVATVKVPHLVYGGVMLPLGDVFDGPPDPNPLDPDEEIAVTRVTGWLK